MKYPTSSWLFLSLIINSNRIPTITFLNRGEPNRTHSTTTHIHTYTRAHMYEPTKKELTYHVSKQQNYTTHVDLLFPLGFLNKNFTNQMNNPFPAKLKKFEPIEARIFYF